MDYAFANPLPLFATAYEKAARVWEVRKPAKAKRTSILSGRRELVLKL